MGDELLLSSVPPTAPASTDPAHLAAAAEAGPSTAAADDGRLMIHHDDDDTNVEEEEYGSETSDDEERPPIGLTFTHISYKGRLVFLNQEDTPFYKTDEIEPNAQEIIGVTPACSCIQEYQAWYSFALDARRLQGNEKRQHKALYHIALDFDIRETNADVIVEAMSKLLHAFSLRYANITEVVNDTDNPIKVAYLTRPSSKRWHVQVLNISFASRRIEAGTDILSSVKSCIMRDVMSYEDLTPQVKKAVHRAGRGGGLAPLAHVRLEKEQRSAGRLPSRLHRAPPPANGRRPVQKHLAMRRLAHRASAPAVHAPHVRQRLAGSHERGLH